MDFSLIAKGTTIFSIVHLIGLFLFRIYKFRSTILPMLSSLSRFDNNDDSLGQADNEILSRIASNYSSTIHSQKTENKAADYFTIENINTSKFNLGYYNGFNNNLIGIGIFYTFLGLAIGVYYFGVTVSNAGSENKSQAISDSVDVLMGGMGTAFASSVLGMGLSIVFSYFYKRWTNKVDAEMSSISFQLDSKFLKTTSDFALERDQQLVRLIDDVMTKNKETSDSRMHSALETSKLTYVDESDKVIGLATMTKGILAESKRQSASLATFSDDLADAFYGAMNRDSGENGSIVTILRDGFQKLLEADRDPVNDLVDSLLTELNKTFAKMTEDITSSIEAVMTDIQSKAGGQVIEQANEAATELNKVTEHISKLPEILNQVNAQTSETASFTDQMIIKVNETIMNLQNVIELQNLAAEEIEKATKVYADKRSEMNTSLDTIKNTSRSLEKSVIKLDSDFDKYTTHTTSLEEERSKNLQSVASLVSDAAQMNTSLIENLEKIESSVKVTFSNISEGLNGYHDQINHNTNVELKAYSDAVVEITKELRAVVNTLNHSIEDLDSRLGKKNK